MLSIFNCVQMNAENRWTKTNASIVKTVIEDTAKGKVLKVTYQYKIGSKTVTATQIQRAEEIRSLNEKSTVSNAEVLQGAKSGFDKNKNLSVYYNPSSPAQSRIADVDLGKLIMLFAGLAGACVCICIASVWNLLHPLKPSPKHFILRDPSINRQAILDSLLESSMKVDSQADSDLPASPLDKSTTENSLDGTTINVKKTEKETL